MDPGLNTAGDGHFVEVPDKDPNIDERDGREIRDEDIVEINSNKIPLDFIEEEINEPCPYIGLEFETQEESYNYYNRYAGRMGFSVRKYSLCKSHLTGDAIGRIFCCSLEGVRDSRSKSVEERKRNRADTRTGCRARLTVRRKGDKWAVTQFTEEHNHDLVPPSKRHKLRSLRKMTEDMMNYMETRDGMGSDIAVILRDSVNCLSTKRQDDVRKGDAEDILYYLERQQLTNPAFFYSIQVDSEGLMTNFFWTDARSRMDYHYFGDVVCFDTTYGKTRFGISFVPLFGVNHHCQIVLFGAAFLLNDSTESLTWMVKTWMNAMNGKQPKLIFTDQGSAVGEVIEKEMVGTHQRYCLWNIMRSAKHNLQHIITAHKGFTDDFTNCLHSSDTVEEFEENWAAMLGKYDLSNDRWLMELYQKREKWSSVYSRYLCSATIYSSFPSENPYFDGFLRRDMPLCELLKKLDRAIMERRVAENDADFESNKMPVLKLTTAIEEEAARVYTKAVFQKFQDQLLASLSFRHKRVVESGTTTIYNVWKTGREQVICSVTFNSCDTSVKCSCQLFEFSGYLCRHILKVFLVEDVQNLPPQYILTRLTKDAKSGPVVNVQAALMQTDYREAQMVRYQKLCQEAINIAIKGSSSVEVYKVAMRCFRNAVRDVEATLRNVSNPSVDLAG
ncbi:hypothetical protein ACHQM5_014340 [Ranunculus cassubicifolius]